MVDLMDDSEARLQIPGEAEFREAAQVLREIIVRTPLVSVPGAEDIWIKPEIHQPAGCFKVRGVHYRVARMDPEERARGISTVSAGNTAKALAWSGRRFGVAARSLMPDSAPQTKIEAMQAYGGTPVLVPAEELFAYLKGHGWEQEPYAFVHPWTDRDVLVGHGTMGLEILEDLPDVDTVFVPVGGGGLMGGVGAAVKAIRPEVRVVAVEPRGCPSLHDAVAAGRPVETACDTICDGVAVPYITDEMFPLLSHLKDRCALVSEEGVEAAIRHLAFRCHVVAEGSGALALAAAMATPVEERGRSVCLITGGSIDAARLGRILEA